MADQQRKELLALGHVIQQALDEAGLNGAVVARKIGVDKATVNRWLHGLKQPRNKPFQRFFDLVEPVLKPMTRRELLGAAKAAGIQLLVSGPRRPEPGTRRPRDTEALSISPTLPAATSHEERAEALNGREHWAAARTSWLLAAEEAAKQGDWPRWARCMIAAAQMDLNLGQLNRSEHAFLDVLHRASAERTLHADAEANIRLGRLYYEQDRFAVAKTVLTTGLRLARSFPSAFATDFRILDNGTTVVCDGHEATVILEALALDYLGRIDIRTGKPQKGLDELEAACRYPRSKGAEWNLGCRLIEKIPGLLLTSDANDNEIRSVLRESRDLLHERPCGDGLHDLARAGWLKASEDGNPMGALEAAHEGFTRHTFAPLGVADVDVELSDRFLPATATHPQALEYALAAVAFRPYGRALTTLVNAASAMFISEHDYDMRKFTRRWRDLEERLAAMQDAPFIDLGPLGDRLGYEAFAKHRAGALTTARKTVEQGVLRRPGSLSS